MTVIACVGTSSTVAKCPSATCWRRDAGSSATIFTSSGIVEVGDGRIVEREVAVLADPAAAQVERMRAQQRGVAVGLGLRVAGVAREVVELLERAACAATRSRM